MTLYAPTSFIAYPKREELAPKAPMRGDYIEEVVKNQHYAFFAPHIVCADVSNSMYINTTSTYITIGTWPIRMPECADEAGSTTVTTKWAVRHCANTGGTRNSDIVLYRVDGFSGTETVLDVHTIGSTSTPQWDSWTASTGLLRDGNEADLIRLKIRKSAGALDDPRFIMSFIVWVEP